MTSTTFNKLSEFSELQPGWHYGQGVSPSAVTIERARDILRVYLKSGIKETDAFCGQHGEVMVTAYHGQDYIECDFEPDGVAHFTHKFGKATHFERAGMSAFSELANLVRKTVSEVLRGTWPSLDSSIREISTNVEWSSKTTYSKTLQVGVRRYSTSNVPLGNLNQSVRTFTNSMEMSGESRPRTGYSIYRRYSPPVATPSRADRERRVVGINAITTLKARPTGTYDAWQKNGSLMIFRSATKTG